MVSGKANLAAWFKIQNKPIFAIFRRGKEDSGNPVFTNKDRESETMESANAFLDQCLSLISTGDFFVYCYTPGGSSSKGRSETHFNISMNEAPALQQNVQQHISGMNGGFDYETMMNKAKEMATEQFLQLQSKAKLEAAEKELLELKKENRELNNKLQTPINKIIGELHPYIGSIAEQLGFKRPLAISGVPHDTHLEENSPHEINGDQAEEMNKAVHAFCEALHELYPNEWIAIINKLTTTIKNEPGKIKMALNFL